MSLLLKSMQEFEFTIISCTLDNFCFSLCRLNTKSSCSMKLKNQLRIIIWLECVVKFTLKKNGHIETCTNQLLTSCTATKLSAEILGQAVAGPVVPVALAAAFAVAAAEAAAFCWVLARREQTLFLRKEHFIVSQFQFLIVDLLVTSIISAWSVVAVTLSLRNLVAFLRVVERRVACLMVSWRWWRRRLRRSIWIDFDGANTSPSDWATGVVVVVWRWSVRTAILGAVLVFLSAVGWVVVFRTAVQGVAASGLAIGVASTVLIFFRSIIGRIIIFRCRWVDWALSSLAVLTCVSVGSRLVGLKMISKYIQPKLESFVTMDWDPARECMCPGCGIGPLGPIVPTICPFGIFGKVWKLRALDGSISSRKPSKWNVAYGQISSSTPFSNELR